MALCPLPSPLYSVLMGYKEAPVAEVRRRAAATVDALFTRFLTQHRRCVFELLKGPVSVVLPVPSSSRPGPPPLDRIRGLSDHVLRATEWLCEGPPLWCPGALERTEVPVGHMAAHPEAFEVPAWAGPIVAHSRILLLDDTYVSGARAQSAAAALRLAGAWRVLIVPIGRVIRPDTIAEHADLLARSRRSRAGKHRCARCVVTQRDAAMWE
ncbi:MAG TPA: hypothetical protein VGF87_03900 [Acidimicrobiales bacterium]|jgi:hypothetical protein